jgi:hypothetical protein
MARWWQQQLEADLAAVDHALEREYQAAMAAGKPWPPQRTPEPALDSSIVRQEPEIHPGPDDQAARLDNLLAQAADAAARITADNADRDARAKYTARVEREAQAEPEPALQADAPDEAEIEL